MPDRAAGRQRALDLDHGTAGVRGERLRRADVRVRILPPIPTAGLAVADVDRLREETRSRIAEALGVPPSPPDPVPAASR